MKNKLWIFSLLVVSLLVLTACTTSTNNATGNVVKEETVKETGEIKEFITAREKMFEIFDGGDRLRIFRTNEFKEHDIIHEISILLNAYKVPFFTYDFSGLRGTVKLTNFL